MADDTPIAPSAGSASVAGNPAALISDSITVMGWSLAEGDIGAATPLQRVMQATFTATGTYGTGGALTLQGSPDNVTWVTFGGFSAADGAYSAGVPSKVGEFVVLPADDGRLVIAVTDQSEGAPIKYFRPVVTGGDLTTALVVTGQLSSHGAI